MSIAPEHHLVAGDVISVTAVLDFGCAPGETIHARIGGRYGMPINPARADATLVRTHVAVGDRVRLAAVPDDVAAGWPSGTIIAVAGERAWVDLGDDGDAVWYLANLRRVLTPEPTPDGAEA